MQRKTNARQYEAGNGVVSQEVINLENYVDDFTTQLPVLSEE